MGGWFSFGRSEPLHVSATSIRKLTSMRNKANRHKLRSYSRKRGLQRGHLSHYNRSAVVQGYESNNDPTYEKRPSTERKPAVVGQKMINNTVAFFRDSPMHKKVSSFVRSMTRKQPKH